MLRRWGHTSPLTQNTPKSNAPNPNAPNPNAPNLFGNTKVAIIEGHPWADSTDAERRVAAKLVTEETNMIATLSNPNLTI